MNKLTVMPAIAGLLFLAGCNSQPAPAPTTEESSPQAQPAAQGDDHSGEMAKLEALFPGATLTKKPLPIAEDAAFHLNNDIKMKFAGGEKGWEVYDASKEGKRVGMIMLTHATIPGKGGHHVAVAVDPKWKISQVVGLEEMGEGFAALASQFKGKDFVSPLKVGSDLKAVTGYDKAAAQSVADTVRRASWLFNEYFNPNGAEMAHEAGHDGKPHADEPHDESKPHTHAPSHVTGNEPHDESKPHAHIDKSNSSEEPHDESVPHTH